MDLTNVFLPRDLHGSLQRGGWLLSGEVLGDTDGLTFGQNVSLEGISGATYLDADWRLFFNGHCLSDPDNLQFDKYTSRAQIQIGTADNLLNGYVQAIGFSQQASPQHEHQMTDLRLSYIAEHILKRHCNALYEAGRTPEGVVTVLDINHADSTPLTIRNTREGNSLWKRVQEVGGGESAGEFFRAWFNRRNEFYYQPAPAFWTSPPVAKGTLTADHIKPPVQVRLNNNRTGERLGQVKLMAVKDATTVYSSEYPTSPGNGSRLSVTSGVFANSQARTDTLAERLYKWNTRPYTLQVEVDPGLVLLGDDGRGLDLADAVNVTYDGPGDDGGAGVHLSLSAAKFYVYEVRVTFDLTGKSARAVLTLEADN